MEQYRIWTDKETDILIELRNQNKTSEQIMLELEKQGYIRSKKSILSKVKKEMSAGRVKRYDHTQNVKPSEYVDSKAIDSIRFERYKAYIKQKLVRDEVVLGHKVVSIQKHYVVVDLVDYRDTYTYDELYQMGAR